MLGPKIDRDGYQAGLDNFHDGGTALDLVSKIHNEKDEVKAISFLVGFIEGVIEQIRKVGKS